MGLGSRDSRNTVVLGATLALLGALAGLVLTSPAAAATSDGPTAIAAAPDGSVFAGFRSGAIVEFDGGSGAKAKRVRIPTGKGRGAVGGIVALDFAPNSDKLWVLDTNRRIQQFSTAGKLRRSLRLGSCSGSLRPAPGVRGGLDVTSDSIYVAHPCRDQVLRYDRAKRKLRASASAVDAHGIAAQADLGAPAASQYLYVTEPDGAHVVKFNLRSLKPESSFDVRGRAADVYVADDGRLFVSITDNDERVGERIYVYDALGVELSNLGRPGTALGDLRDPVAFDFHPLDSSDFSENLFIADAGNERVQRWSDSGFTFWGADAIDPR